MVDFECISCVIIGSQEVVLVLVWDAELRGVNSFLAMFFLTGQCFSSRSFPPLGVVKQPPFREVFTSECVRITS